MQVERRIEQRDAASPTARAHHWLILHGRYVCKARLPQCWRCVVSEICAFPAKTTISGTLPAKKTEPKVDTAGKRARR